MFHLRKKGKKLTDAITGNEVCNQIVEKTFKTPIDLSDKKGFSVSIKGNGKANSGIALTLKCATHRGVLRFYIDTDFEGTRDFVLIETDNGDRRDLPFDNSFVSKNYPGNYNVGRDPYHYHSFNYISIDSWGDVSGVEMSDIKVCTRIEETIVNPTIKTDGGEIVFECNLRSGEYIEFDGISAKVYDYIGTSKEIPFKGKIKAPKGEFSVNLSSESKTKNVLNAKLTLGFSGNIVK